MKLGVFWLSVCLMLFLSAPAASQTVPLKISSILDEKYSGWTLSENKCGEKKSVFEADFNGDGLDDYVIQFVASRKDGKRLIYEVAFYSKGLDFSADDLFEENYDGIGTKLAFEIFPVGTDLKLNP
ncbi:MAG TPA: hypothetical protein VGI80_05565, partial [Pyrinomonadaceae bacterium]